MKTFCFELTQGTDRTYKFGALDSAGKQIKFGGYSAFLQVKANEFSSVAIDTLTTENGRITLEPDDLLFVVTFPNAKTKSYPVGRLVYDLKVKSSGGEITSLVSGHIDVKAGITDVL